MRGPFAFTGRRFGLAVFGEHWVLDQEDGDKVDKALWEPGKEGMPHVAGDIRRLAVHEVRGLFV